MITRFIKTLGRHSSTARKLLCAGALLAGGVLPSSAQLKKVGTGTDQNAVNEYPTPFGNNKAGQKAVYLYTASEMTAAGLKPGWIDAMSFLVKATNSAIGHADLRFYVDSWSASDLTGSTVPAFSSLTLRWNNKTASYVPILGYNTFNFSAPYYWNGTDNIIVGTCFWSGIDLYNASVEMTRNLGFNGSRTFTASASTGLGSGVCDGARATAAATDSSKNRPNVYFMMHSDTCKLKPAAGSAKSSTTAYCVFDDSLELSLTGNTLAYGLSFQWQVSTSATGPWANLGSSSTTKVNIKTIQSVSSYYRCVVTCVATSVSDTSKVIYVPMAPPYNCDCASEATTIGKEKILSVKLAGVTNATPCGPATLGYSDFTSGALAIAPIDVEPGTGYTLETRLSSCDGSNSARAVKVYIDYDQSATYEVSEMVYANTYSALQPNPQLATGDFIIPVSAKKGLTTMRIIYAQTTSLSSISPCGKYTQGERRLPYQCPSIWQTYC
ncbi:MAG: GEVED domain-containing protein [Chitinophagaceae bacterium]